MLPRILSWDAVVASRGQLYPWLSNSAKPKLGRIEPVISGNEIMPALILRCPDSGFRTRLSNDTPTTILMDVVTVSPCPTPIAYVMPVIVDQPADPFWTFMFINLFAVDTYRGIPIVTFPDRASYSGTATARLFSESPKRCGLLVVNESNDLRISKIIPCQTLSRERAAEVSEVLRFIEQSGCSKSLEDFQIATEAFNLAFCAMVDLPGGGSLILPKDRSLIAADSGVYRLALEHGRLLDRRGLSKYRPDRKKTYDIFISHAHADSAVAQLLVGFLKAVWPKIRIASTRAGGEAEFNADPKYFIEDSHSSGAIVFLATPNSLERHMVHLELAVNAYKPIVTVLYDLSVAQLREKFDANLFIKLNLEAIVSLEDERSWLAFVTRLSAITHFEIPDALPSSPGKIGIIVAQRDSVQDLEKFVSDYRFMTTHNLLTQSRVEAEALVDRIIEHRVKAGLKHGVLGETAYDKLVECLSYVNDVAGWRLLLESVPALVDQGLLTTLDELKTVFVDSGMGEAAEAVSRIYAEADSLFQILQNARNRIA